MTRSLMMHGRFADAGTDVLSTDADGLYFVRGENVETPGVVMIYCIGAMPNSPGLFAREFSALDGITYRVAHVGALPPAPDLPDPQSVLDRGFIAIRLERA